MLANSIKNIKLVDSKIEIVREIKDNLSPEEIEDKLNVLMSIKLEYEKKISDINNELEILNNFKQNNTQLFDNLRPNVIDVIKNFD